MTTIPIIFAVGAAASAAQGLTLSEAQLGNFLRKSGFTEVSVQREGPAFERDGTRLQLSPQVAIVSDRDGPVVGVWLYQVWRAASPIDEKWLSNDTYIKYLDGSIRVERLIPMTKGKELFLKEAAEFYRHMKEFEGRFAAKPSSEAGKPPPIREDVVIYQLEREDAQYLKTCWGWRYALNGLIGHGPSWLVPWTVNNQDFYFSAPVLRKPEILTIRTEGSKPMEVDLRPGMTVRQLKERIEAYVAAAIQSRRDKIR